MMGFPRVLNGTELAMKAVDGLPVRWQKRLVHRWQQLYWWKGTVAANGFLGDTLGILAKVRIPLDSKDAEICDRAYTLAWTCAQRATLCHDADTLRGAMERVAAGQGVEPPSRKKFAQHGPALARMTCPYWWRRKLRAHHGRSLETAAIRIGCVSKREQIYCSNETVWAMRQRDAKSARMLEETMAVNELGQKFALAELVGKSTSNKALRRAELMTRLSGFERIARASGHDGLFITVTCPARMHRMRTFNGGEVVKDNQKFDGTTPRQGQEYLAKKVWAPCRAKLAKLGIKLYGFRIAEPQHDGTPHWHLLVFCDPRVTAVVKEVVTDYALRDSGDEKGAQDARVKFEDIDWSRGTAAGYVAKYIAKNTDGFKLEFDKDGETPAIVAVERVQMWARAWGIRQFQQLGGPPVTVWRELRRIEALPVGAPAHLVKAHNAVNKVAVIEGRETASVAWDHYCEAQGGVFCGRKYLIRLDVQEQQGANRYGEPMGMRPVGIYTSAMETWASPHVPGAQLPRQVEWFVESSRHVWEIVWNKAQRPLQSCAPRAPWTCVNNCTGSANDGVTAANAGGAESLESGPGTHQIDGWQVHGAVIDRARVALQPLPYGGWRENDPNYLQGYELQQWKRLHLHGPWPARDAQIKKALMCCNT